MKSLRQSKHSTRRFVLVSCASFILIVIAYLGFAYATDSYPFTQNNEPSVSDEIKQKVGDRKSSRNNEASGTPSDSSVTSNDVPVDENLSVKIAATSQANGVVSVSASTSGGTGTCVFLFTNPDDRPVTREATSTDSTCSTTINEAEFSRLGDWQLRTTFYSNNKKAEATSNVTIR